MRGFCFLLVYVILTKQTTSQAVLCSSNLENGNVPSNYDSDPKKAVQACIQNISHCIGGSVIVFPLSTLTTQAMSTPSKTND